MLEGCTKRTIDRSHKFLLHLAEVCSVSKACKLSKLSRRTAYDLKSSDREFSDAWDKALDIGFDKLEEEAIRRAYDGYLKPIYRGGILVGRVREYSDTLMCLLLKGRKRRVYGDKHEHSGPDGSAIPVVNIPADTLTDDQLAAIIAGSKK